MKALNGLGLAVAMLCASALLAQQDAEGVLAEASDYFRQGLELRDSDPTRAAEMYRRAALRYETLLEEHGIASSQLHYNLANAYFQLEDTGRAILHYLKAARLDPGDPNVRRNLDLARASRTDRLETDSGGQIVRTLLFWHYDLGWAPRIQLFAGAWCLFWLVVLLRWFGKSWAPREIATGSGTVALLLLLSLAAETIHERRTVPGVVVASETVARQGDGRSYEPSFEDPLHAGAEFRLIEERPGWLRVELPDGRRCWLSAADAELVR